VNFHSQSAKFPSTAKITKDTKVDILIPNFVIFVSFVVK